jgi:hypothetical protein
MRHLVKLGALLCVLAIAAGCGDDGDDGTATETPSASESTSQATETPTESPSASETSEAPEPEGTVIAISFKDGEVTPAGDRVEAKAGEPIIFEIDADAPGELHVHSTPDHEIEFEAGTSSQEIVIDQPGIVEVELHEPAIVVVQLEVR